MRVLPPVSLPMSSSSLSSGCRAASSLRAFLRLLGLLGATCAPPVALLLLLLPLLLPLLLLLLAAVVPRSICDIGTRAFAPDTLALMCVREWFVCVCVCVCVCV